MKLLSTNTCKTPKDLSLVTTTRHEQAAELGGMTPAQIQKIWHSVEQFYNTGNSPMVSLCIRRQGQIVLNRAIGHARGNAPGHID
ncbi:hypothetical protein RJJ65_36025, partial [Rhizobium hidalgonense]